MSHSSLTLPLSPPRQDMSGKHSGDLGTSVSLWCVEKACHLCHLLLYLVGVPAWLPNSHAAGATSPQHAPTMYLQCADSLLNVHQSNVNVRISCVSDARDGWLLQVSPSHMPSLPSLFPSLCALLPYTLIVLVTPSLPHPLSLAIELRQQL